VASAVSEGSEQPSSPGVERLGVEVEGRQEVAQAPERRLDIAGGMGEGPLGGKCDRSACVQHEGNAIAEILIGTRMPHHPRCRFTRGRLKLVGRRQHGDSVHAHGS